MIGKSIKHINLAIQCRIYVRYELSVRSAIDCAENADNHTMGIFRSPNLSQRSSIVYAPTNRVTNNPTHLTLMTIRWGTGMIETDSGILPSYAAYG